MSRPKPLSGFPEYAPEARIIEQFVLDRLRETFELHGFRLDRDARGRAAGSLGQTGRDRQRGLHRATAAW